jgi:hypothetical protein
MPPNFGGAPPPGFMGGAAPAGGEQGAGTVANTMLDMLKDPQMQVGAAVGLVRWVLWCWVLVRWVLWCWVLVMWVLL